MDNNFILKDSNKIEFSVEGKGYIKVYPPLTDIEITPNKETQTFKNSEEYGYDHITVKPIPETYINPTGSLTINENGVKNVREYNNVVVDIPIPEPEVVIPDGYILPEGTKEITTNGVTNVKEYENVNVNVEIPEVDLQEKSITPTKETQEVTPDLEYDGLGKVTVNPIPDEYIIPEGTLPITENITYDVTNYAKVTASVKSIPNLQAKSITINQNGNITLTPDSEYDGLSQVEINTIVSGGGSGGISQPFMLEGVINEVTTTSTNFSLMNLNVRSLPNMLLVFWYARSNCSISDNVTVLYQSETIVYDGTSQQTLYIGYMPLSITNWSQLNSIDITLTQETSGRLGIGVIPLTNSDIPVIVEETGSNTDGTLSFETDEYLNFYIWTQVYAASLNNTNKFPFKKGDRLGYFISNAPDNDFTVNWTGNSYNRFIQVRCPYKKG